MANNDRTVQLGIIGKDADDGDVAANVAGKYRWFVNESRLVRRQWLINSAFTRGQQFHVLHDTDDRLIYLQQPPGRKQVMDDLIGPWKDHLVANMVQAMPEFRAIPKSPDREAVSGARLADALLAYYWQSWQFIYQYIELCGYLVDFGNAFVFFNYTVDKSHYTLSLKRDAVTGDALIDDDGNLVYERKPKSDIVARVLPPQYIGCPMDTYPIEDKPWVTIAQKRDLDYFKANYDDGGEVTPEGDDAREQYALHRISRAQRGGNAGTAEYATEITYMQRPQDGNPEGMVVVMAGNRVLKREKWPYEKLMTYPLEHFHYPKEAGEFFARSRVDKQISLQKMLNLVVSCLAENVDDMGHIKWLIPLQGETGKITDVPDIVRYMYPYKPEQVPPAPLPAYITNVTDYLRMAIRDVQQYHGASMGTAVSGVRSEVHAQNLQDQDLLPLSVLDNLMQVSFERMGKKVLEIAADKLDDGTLLSYTGKNYEISVANFRAALLDGVDRVRVRMAGAFMRSKAGTTQNIIEMFRYGMITDKYGQSDAQKAFRLLEFALPDSAFLELQAQTEQIYREISLLVQGQAVGAYPWQDHKLHLDIHQEFMNSPEFMKLVESANDDEQAMKVVMMYQQHVAAHSQMLAEAIGAIAPQGQTPQSGRSSEGAPTREAGASNEEE